MTDEGSTGVSIRDVWADNLDEEFAELRKVIQQDFRFIAMDTEFPGVVARPVGMFGTIDEINYERVSCNVDVLKLIQVGLSAFDSHGNLPPTGGVWQFNFSFALGDDLFSADSVQLLRNAGIDFDRHRVDGITVEDFGELLTTSGLIGEESITWLSFHSAYDFGYLIKSMTLASLPVDETMFFNCHRKLFPSSYDVRMLMKLPGPTQAMLRGGLQEVATQLQVKRYGAQHQAGSDSLLTGQTFFRIRERFFKDCFDDAASTVVGQLYGFGELLGDELTVQRLDATTNDVVVGGPNLLEEEL